MPDRLPSLLVLAGFWIIPACAGWYTAGSVARRSPRRRKGTTRTILAMFLLSYSVAWYFFNLHRMPPYIPGATRDPTYASAEAARALAIFVWVVILPGSVFAAAIGFVRRQRMLRVVKEVRGVQGAHR